MASKRRVFGALLAAVVFVSSFNFAYTGTVKASTEPSENYDVWWDFEEEIWPATAAGTQISGAANASMLLTHETSGDGSKYMKAAGNHASAWRATRYGLSDDALSGTEVVFDFMPIKTNGNTRYGDFMFLSSADNYSFFNITFNQALQIFYYNSPGVNYSIDPYAGIDLNGSALTDGSHNYRVSQLQDTGLQGDGSTWFSVKVHFDYMNSQADLTITNKSDPSQSFARSDIPIREAAVNVNRFLLTAFKGQPEFGFDNFGVKYHHLDAASIGAVAQPADEMVVASEWEQHVGSRPVKAAATMGDGSIKEFELGEWTSTPEFQEDVYTTYTWTAPLIVPEGIQNPKNIALTYKVQYIGGYFATGAYDPTALELDYGSVATIDELMELLPKQTHAVLNNGQIVKMDIDADTWIATYTTLQDLGSYKPVQFDSPEFNPEQEGIYVYKAKLKSTGDYDVNSDIWIESRINYFSYENNFNGFERSMENLDRGLYAIKNKLYDSATKTYVESSQGGIFLSWRILVDEYARVSEGQDIVFDIYRNGMKIDTLENLTNYLDTEGEVGDTYLIKTTQAGKESLSKEAAALEDNYLSLKLQRPLPSYSQTGNFAVYRLNDLGVADVDGDGVYEIVVKWYPNNGFDPGVSGTNRMSSPHIMDVYKLDGTALWRLNMGYSSPAGQHFDNFMFYDLDQDGKAEFSILTQDGSRTYRPDENGQFRYVTTDEGGYMFQSADPSQSESAGTYVQSDNGQGYVLSNAPEYDFAYVGEFGSPVMDDEYLIDVVGDIDREGVNMLSNGFKDISVNEYFTVFNGETGEMIDTVDYIYNSANVVGSEGFNLGNRYNIALAYIPADLENPGEETIPAVLANRAYYARATVAAYTLVDGKIQLAWHTDTVNEIKGGGNHNLVTGDMDNDGYDELYIGGTSIDHDGTVLWAKDGEYNKDFMKHGDMIHMSAVFPDSDQLYVFTPVEDGSVSTMLNYALTNAATGARIVGHTFGRGDTGSGMLANVTPNAGYEVWSSVPSGTVNGRRSDVFFNAYGEVVTHDGNALKRPAVQTWSGYWDGDLLSELPDSSPTRGPDKSGFPMAVHKYNWETGETETIASFGGTLTNNSTKNNPGLMADIMGDWREEILVRSADNEELRIYKTSIPTDYMIYTLMHDSVYRNAVANQNTTYNQPAHTSFYLGEDEVSRNRVLSFELPTYNYKYTAQLDEPVVPGEVSEVQVVEGNGQLTLRWQDPTKSGSGLKHIDVAAYEGGTLKASTTVAPGKEQATLTGLTNGVMYTVRFVAVDSNDTASLTVVVSGTPRNSSDGNSGTPTSPPVTGGGNHEPKVEVGPDGTIIVQTDTVGADDPALNVALSADIVKRALESAPDDKLRIQSDGASITFDGQWIGDLKLIGNLVVTIEKKNASDLPALVRTQAGLNEGDSIYNIRLAANGQSIDSIERGAATVSLNHEADSGANAHQIVMYELAEDGSLIPVILSRLDTVKERFVFQPNNLAAYYVVLQSEIGFEDAGGWSQEAIEALAARGIVKGKGNDLFDSQGAVTRAEFTAMLARMFDFPAAKADLPFNDVPVGAWYSGDLAAAYALGIVNGRADGSFGGNDRITREEMNVLLYRAATLLTLLPASSSGSGITFSDASEIAAYAGEAIRQLNQAGLVSGLPDGTFAPKNTATREQAAAMLWRLLKQLNG